ncbi:MAG: 2-oxoacid:acceptor oxidoreductase family protein [Zestosphaera sp.]
MSESKIVNILISSVGGQGGLTLSRVIAVASVLSGYSVRTGETLGMAQRFGSVLSYVRVGIDGIVYSPLFDEGEAHYMVCMEVIECARALKYLGRDGVLIVDDVVKPPTSMSLVGSGSEIKSVLLKQISSTIDSARFFLVPAKRIAIELGSSRAANMVLLGVLNGISKLFSESAVTEAVSSLLSNSAREPSLLAYRRGVDYIKHL